MLSSNRSFDKVGTHGGGGEAAASTLRK